MFINMMSAITSLLVLLILKDCSGHSIEGCGPDNPMDVDINTNIFKCVGHTSTDCVSWHVQKVNGRQSVAAACVVSPDQFSIFQSNVRAYRNDDTSSILEISSTDMSDFLSITCRLFDNPVTYNTTYMNDYTCSLTKRDPPTLSCELQRQQDNSYSVVCSILNMYALRRPYSCQFTARFEDDTTEPVSDSTFIKTEIARGPATGSCMAPNLPTTGTIRNVEAILLLDNIRAIANLP